MTSDCEKRWRRVVLRGIGAVFFSWAVISALVLLISTYGIAPEHARGAKTVAIQAIKFPENEQMLNEVTAQVAHEGEALSKVEPAAGSIQQIK